MSEPFKLSSIDKTEEFLKHCHWHITTCNHLFNHFQGIAAFSDIEPTTFLKALSAMAWPPALQELQTMHAY